MTPAIGRIVHLRLPAACAEQINKARQCHADTDDRGMVASTGAVLRQGNTVSEGDEYPLVITRVWTGDHASVNGQVLLDGNDTLWATSVVEGTEPGTWHWPERIE